MDSTFPDLSALRGGAVALLARLPFIANAQAAPCQRQIGSHSPVGTLTTPCPTRSPIADRSNIGSNADEPDRQPDGKYAVASDMGFASTSRPLISRRGSWFRRWVRAPSLLVRLLRPVLRLVFTRRLTRMGLTRSTPRRATTTIAV